MTKTHLAELVGLTVRSLSAYESGDTIPQSTTIASISSALRFPTEFFGGQDMEEPSPEGTSFRAAASLTAGKRDAALGAGALAFLIGNWIEKRFDLPGPNVPDMRGQSPEAAAEGLRALWGPGELAIANVVHLLEAQGVRVFSLVEDCHEIDAFSVWKNGTPFVFLNTKKSGERSRFDAAHELGHLVLHRHGSPQGREAEREADEFASAFLMPRASVLAVAPRFPTVAQLVALKRRWKVSVAALTRRLRDLGMLSEWHYRTLFQEISQRGFRRFEPAAIPHEASQLLWKVFTALREDGIRKRDVAKELLIDPAELDALVFGLVVRKIEGGRGGDDPGPGPNQPKLRIL